MDVLMLSLLIGATLPLVLCFCASYQQFIASDDTIEKLSEDISEEKPLGDKIAEDLEKKCNQFLKSSAVDPAVEKDVAAMMKIIFSDRDFREKFNQPSKNREEITNYLKNTATTLLSLVEKTDPQKELSPLLKEC